METKEEELSRCREELAYWTKEKIQFCIDYYTERVRELEGEKCTYAETAIDHL